MNEGKKLVYSGDLLRKFLHQKKLTYKEAAKELGLDKNTIGKAVRGGNMNINVLLNIANHWKIPITNFFTWVNNEECGESYFISSAKYQAWQEDEDSTVPKPLKSIKILKIHQSKT